jgi:adenine-specific DNA-methyltransferase
VIKYLGSKRTLLPNIVALVRGLGSDVRSVLDAFSGTARVGHALKAEGYRVVSNDLNAYAHVLATCYVQADREDVERDAERLIAELSALPGRPGYFTETFCEKARYFQPKNGARIDAMREAIAEKGLEPELEAVLLVSLMEAADRVDSTTGVQMAYLKGWAARAHNELELRMPRVLPRAQHGKGRATRGEAAVAATQEQVDLVYLDPPYNQHSYLGNYHVWESLVLWDKPAVYGVAQKRVDVRERASAFNKKRAFAAALEELVASVRARFLVVSFSDEGFVSCERMETLLGTRGRVRTLEHDFKRYVGAQIGIYDPTGKKVGRVGHLRNKEYLYVVELDQGYGTALPLDAQPLDAQPLDAQPLDAQPLDQRATQDSNLRPSASEADALSS